MSAARASAARPARGGAWTIAARELGAAFDSPIAYVTAIGFVLLANSSFMNEFFLAGRLDMAPYFQLLPLLYVFFLPAITMRSWAEEKKTRTFEVLLTLPLTSLQIAWGKFLAALALLALWLAGSLPILGMLWALGDPDPGPILGGYLAAFLLGALFLAFGLVLSAFSADQIVAFVLSTLVGAVLVLSGHERVVAVIDGLSPERAIGTWLFEHVSALPPYEELVRGAVRLADVGWFVGLTILCVWISSLVVQKSRA